MRGRDGGDGGNRGRGRDGGGGGHGRGRGGQGRGRGGYGGRGRGGGGGGRRHHDNRRGGRRDSRPRRDPRAASHSGNKRERIAVESGFLVLIDQFMLANPQFTDKLIETLDQDPEAKDSLIQQYGGAVVEVSPGTYRIDRDPYAYTIVIHQSGDSLDGDNLAERAKDGKGHVYIDTRCLAMVDRELLDDTGLLEKYQQLWFGGEEKACRDLLRDNGGAVRYGFRRYGDELGVYSVPEEDVVCLWPDVSEPDVSASAEKGAEEQ